MDVEVSVALNFVISYLYNKLPRRRVDSFGEELERGLKRKFEGHWYPDKPYKGSGFRCIRVSGEKIDPAIDVSARNSGLNIDEIKEYLPKDLTVWIDPHEVSYRIGEKGVAKILYSDRTRDDHEVCETVDREVQNANRGFNPEAQCFKPIDSLSSSLSNLSLSPSPNGWGSSHSASVSPSSSTPTAPPTANQSTSPVTSYLNRQNATPTMTAAMFAQTKFGSTKLKTQSKRPSRLSPTELGAYLKQRTSTVPAGMPNTQPGSWPNTPVVGPVHPFIQGRQCRALSPRDLRQEYLLEQQRLLFLQQAQLQSQLSQTQLATLNVSPPQLPSQSQLSQSQPTPSQNGLLSPGQCGGTLELGGGPSHVSGQGNHDGGSGGQPGAKAPSGSTQGTPSPSSPGDNPSLQGSLNWNSLPPYAGLQHLLVAN